MEYWDPKGKVEQTILSTERMNLGGILQPLEGLGNERLRGEIPLIAKVKWFLDGYILEEDKFNEWKWMICLSS